MTLLEDLVPSMKAQIKSVPTIIYLTKTVNQEGNGRQV